MQPCPVLRFNPDQRGTGAFHQGGDEAVQALKLRQGKEQVPLEQFERSSRIRAVIFQKTLAQPVGKTCGHAAGEPVPAFAADADDQWLDRSLSVCLDSVKHRSDEGGIVLTVTIHCGNPWGTGSPDGRTQGSGFAQALRMNEDTQFRENGTAGFLQFLECVVRAAIIQEDDFRWRKSGQSRTDFCTDGQNVVALIEDGHDNSQ